MTNIFPNNSPSDATKLGALAFPSKSLTAPIMRKPLYIVLAAALFILSNLALPNQGHAQPFDTWELVPGPPHGYANQPSNYAVTFAANYIESDGGSFSARIAKRNQPECFAIVNYSWSFSHSLDVIRQGDIIDVQSDISIEAPNNCHPPLDPQMALRPSKGAAYNSKLLGRVQNAEQEVILWYPERPQGSINLSLDGDRGLMSDGVINQFLVDNSPGNATEDTHRAIFTVHMGYRGTVYEVYYVFSAENNGGSALGNATDEPQIVAGRTCNYPVLADWLCEKLDTPAPETSNVACRWVSAGVGDIAYHRHKVGRSNGSHPLPRYCQPNTEISAVCWSAGENGSGGPWCTYKDLPASQVSGGAHPGNLYKCDC